MSEAVVARGRDWLAELREAIEAGEIEAIGTVVQSIAASAPELREVTCAAVSKLSEDEEGLRRWAENFFVAPGTAQPKAPALRRERRKIEVKREPDWLKLHHRMFSPNSAKPANIQG